MWLSLVVALVLGTAALCASANDSDVNDIPWADFQDFTDTVRQAQGQEVSLSPTPSPSDSGTPTDGPTTGPVSPWPVTPPPSMMIMHPPDACVGIVGALQCGPAEYQDDDLEFAKKQAANAEGLILTQNVSARVAPAFVPRQHLSHVYPNLGTNAVISRARAPQFASVGLGWCTTISSAFQRTESNRNEEQLAVSCGCPLFVRSLNGMRRHFFWSVASSGLQQEAGVSPILKVQ